MILTGIFFPLYHPSFIFLCWSVSLFSYSFRLPLPHHWLNQKVPHTLLLTEVAGILLYILLSLSPSLHHTMVIILITLLRRLRDSYRTCVFALQRCSFRFCTANVKNWNYGIGLVAACVYGAWFQGRSHKSAFLI